MAPRVHEKVAQDVTSSTPSFAWSPSQKCLALRNANPSPACAAQRQLPRTCEPLSAATFLMAAMRLSESRCASLMLRRPSSAICSSRACFGAPTCSYGDSCCRSITRNLACLLLAQESAAAAGSCQQSPPQSGRHWTIWLWLGLLCAPAEHNKSNPGHTVDSGAVQHEGQLPYLACLHARLALGRELLQAPARALLVTAQALHRRPAG